MEKVVAIIQARMSSSRLPRKVALDICGQPLLERVIRQVQRSTLVNSIVVATSTEQEDDIVELISRRVGVRCFRGSLDDVRSRFVAVGKQEETSMIVRVTADNPLTDPCLLDRLVMTLQHDTTLDYCTINKDRVPIGIRAEAFRYAALLDTIALDDSDYSKEHVTPGVIRLCNVLLIDPEDAYALEDFNLSIDTFEDYLRVNELFATYGSSDDIVQRLIADVQRSRRNAASVV